MWIWCEGDQAYDLELYPSKTPNSAIATACIIEMWMGLQPRAGWLMSDLKETKVLAMGNSMNCKDNIASFDLEKAGRNEVSHCQH